MLHNSISCKLLHQDGQQRCYKRSYSSLPGWRQADAGLNGERPHLGGFFPRYNQLRLTHLIVVFLALVIILSLAGCDSSRQSQESSRPSIQTNLYGRMDSYEPVGFDTTPFASLIQHSFCEEGGDFDPDISSDNNWIVFSSLRNSPNPDIYIKRVSGFTATRLTSDPASEIQPCFSPDGSKVAYANNRSGSWDIWVVGVDGTDPIRMTTGVSNDIHPSWSPDGKQLVYCSYGLRSNQWELWLVDTNNPSVKKWIGYGLFPEWSPNPKINKIAFQLARYRGSQWFSVWTVDIIDDEAKFPTEIVSNINYACITPSWSSSGTQLAFCTVSKSVYENDDPAVPGSSGEDIWLIGLDGRNAHRITNSDSADYSPTWSSDGKVFFCSDRKYIDNIWSTKPHGVNFSTEEPVQLSQHPQRAVLAN